MKPSGYKGSLRRRLYAEYGQVSKKNRGKVLPNKIFAGNNKIIVYISGPHMVYSK